MYGFFFSSRRRHTRSKRDWSSDVCSSDLGSPIFFYQLWAFIAPALESSEKWKTRGNTAFITTFFLLGRSEERRVGKECRSRRSRGHYKKINNGIYDTLL